MRDGLVRLHPEWREKLGDDHTLSIAALGELSETALTRDAEIKLGENGPAVTPSSLAATSCS